MNQEFLIDGDHEEMVQNWLDECKAKGWDPDTGKALGPDSEPSPWED